MSESCRPGISFLYQLYEKDQNDVYTSLQKEVQETSLHQGMVGEEMPYKLRNDAMVTILLFICFIIASYIIGRASKYLASQFSSFFTTKSRMSFFDEKTSSDVRYRLFLITQTTILTGFCFYYFFSEKDLDIFSQYSGYIILSSFVVLVALYLLLKLVSYSSINWIFFEKEENQIWIESYFDVIIWLGFLLFPVVLLITYFDLSNQIVTYLLISILVLIKLLLFYKCFRNFFYKFYGFFLLILYFCALEILPDLVLWKGIVLVNNYLVLNY